MFSCKKPNAKYCSVIDNLDNAVDVMGKNDVLIVFASTNDVGSENSMESVTSSLDCLLALTYQTNVLVFGIPCRWDAM